MTNPRLASMGLATAGLLIVVSLVVWLGWVVTLWSWTIDDSFITFRYSRRLADGAGLRWNRGEAPVQGYTSFLWVLINVIPHWLAIDVPGFAKVVSLLAMSIGASLIASLCWRLLADLPTYLRWIAAGSAAAVVLAEPATAIHSVSGMETAWTTFLVCLVAYLTCLADSGSSRRLRWMIAVACLVLGLTRPEGNILGLTVVATLLGRDRSLGREFDWQPPLLGYILPGAVYFAAQWAYFGLPFPLPFYVKSSAPWSGVDVVLEFYRYGVGWLSLPALVGLIVEHGRLRHVAIAVALHSLFFLYPEHMMGYSWRYLFPYFPVIVAAAVVGMARLSGLPESVRASSMLALAFYGIAIPQPAAQQVPAFEAYANGLARAHRRLAEDLLAMGKDLESTPRLVISDAGIVPYLTDWTTIDSLGLNDAFIARFAGSDVEYVYRQNPEIVVVLSLESREISTRVPFEYPIAQEAIRREYQVAAVYQFGGDGDLPYGGYYLWVLARPDLVKEGRHYLHGHIPLDQLSLQRELISSGHRSQDRPPD